MGYRIGQTVAGSLPEEHVGRRLVLDGEMRPTSVLALSGSVASVAVGAKVVVRTGRTASGTFLGEWFF